MRRCQSAKKKKRADPFFSVHQPRCRILNSPHFPRVSNGIQNCPPPTLTHAGVVTEQRSCLVSLHAWLRVLHHPYKVARLRSERPRRHTSGDESGSLCTPLGGINVLVMSDSSQAAEPGSRVGGFHHTNLSHDPTVWF